MKKAKDGASISPSASRNGSTRRKGRPHPRELDHAVQRYADLYDLAPIGYVSFDRSGRIEEINLAAAQLFGVPRERLIGMPFMVFVAREDTPLFLHHLLRCRCSDTRVETELRLKDVKRKITHAYLSSTPIAVSVHNGPLLYQTAIIDLTERKAAEEALHEKEAELELITTQTPFMLTRCTRDLRYRYVSRAYAEMLGRKPEELTGKRIVDVIGKEALAIIRPYVELVLSDQTITFEAEMPYQNGERRCVHSVYVPDKNAEGEVIGWIASLVDVTERKQAESRFRLAVEAAPNAMIMVNEKGEILLANSQTERVFGYSREELLGKRVEMLVPQRLRQRHKGYRAHFSAAPETRAMGAGRDLYGLHKDGSEVPIEIGLNPIQMGGQTFILSSIVDITERKKAEVILQKSRELLEKLVRERTHELYATNKELKKEIEHRKGLEGEILAVSDREQQRLGQELHDGLCQHLTAVAFMARSVALRLKNHRVIDAADIDKIALLVNDAAADTRDLSRALHRVDVDSAALVGALQDLVDREIWRTPCRLDVKPSFRINDDMVAAHLYRIAREAVINANKHAQARQIVVKLERSRRGMVLRVIDDGVGLSTDSKLKQGLGFHIMNYRAQLMGGRLEIGSPKGGGMCVSCYLPDGAVSAH